MNRSSPLGLVRAVVADWWFSRGVLLDRVRVERPVVDVHRRAEDELFYLAAEDVDGLFGLVRRETHHVDNAVGVDLVVAGGGRSAPSLRSP